MFPVEEKSSVLRGNVAMLVETEVGGTVSVSGERLGLWNVWNTRRVLILQEMHGFCILQLQKERERG